MMYDIMPESRENAKEILKEQFNEEDTEKVLELTHCEPPENFFITSEDMVGKSGVWAHFGSWDFDRALIYNTLKKKEFENNVENSVNFLQERFDFSDNEAENLYYEIQSITSSNQANSWIAPWPGYAGSAGCSRIDSETLRCDVSGIPLIVNLTAQDVYAEAQGGRVHPKFISFPTNEDVILKEYNESTITLQNGRQLGIALIKNGENYQAIAMDSDLTGSMFTRMFYQEGIGLKYFKKFGEERSVFGGKIIVWKVDWEGKEKNIIEVPEQPDHQGNMEDSIAPQDTDEIEENESLKKENKTKQIESSNETENQENIDDQENSSENISQNT